MKAIRISVLLFLFLTALGASAQTPPNAEQVLTQAKAKAAAEHKTIFLHFGASWCGWCRRLEQFIATPEIKPVFEKYFVPVKLVVLEKPADRILENEGGSVILEKTGGLNSGLPFSAFLDAKGETIINSKRDGSHNIGHPMQPEEIEWFVAMMKKAAPQMTDADLKTIENALKSQKK